MIRLFFTNWVVIVINNESFTVRAMFGEIVFALQTASGLCAQDIAVTESRLRYETF